MLSISTTLTFTIVLVIVTIPMRGQVVGPSTSDPKETLERFCKVDAEGGRLTEAGWRETADFFVKPSPRPKRRTILVIKTMGVVWGQKDQNEKALKRPLHVDNIFVLGRIDSSGRFSKAIAPGLRAPVSIAEVYDLVLTDTHWEFQKNGELKKEKGLSAWRISSFQAEPRVGVEAGLRYLTRLKDTTDDPVIKKNVEATMATIRSLTASDR